MERVRLKTPPFVPPSEFTPDLIKRFCRLIRKGLPADAVCDYLCIRAAVYYRWLERGERYLDGGGTPPEDAHYGEFARRFKRATARYRMEQLRELHTVEGPGAWIRHMAILERRDRKNFGRNEPAGGTDENYQVDERFD